MPITLTDDEALTAQALAAIAATSIASQAGRLGTELAAPHYDLLAKLGARMDSFDRIETGEWHGDRSC